MRKHGHRAKCANAKDDREADNERIFEGEARNEGIFEEGEDDLLVHSRRCSRSKPPPRYKKRPYQI